MVQANGSMQVKDMDLAQLKQLVIWSSVQVAFLRGLERKIKHGISLMMCMLKRNLLNMDSQRFKGRYMSGIIVSSKRYKMQLSFTQATVR